MPNCESGYKYINQKVLSSLCKRAYESKKPIRCMISLTNLCNLNCNFCAYSYNSKSQYIGTSTIVERDWENMVLQIKKAGVLYLTLTGGEPTIYEGFSELYKFISNLGFIVTLKTNASNLSNDLIKLFSVYPPRYVFISLYGGSEATYDAVTGNPAAYMKTLESIRFFSLIGVDTNVIVPVIKHTVHELPVISSTLDGLRVKWKTYTDIYPHIDKNIDNNYDKFRLSPAQRVCVMRHHPMDVETALRKAEILGCELASWKRPVKQDIYEGQTHRCLDACIGCFINSIGRMSYCTDFITHSVNPFSTNFVNAWNNLYNEMSIHYPQIMPYCDKCEYKAWCTHNCPPRFYLETSSMTRPSDYICQSAYLSKRYDELF